MRIINLILTSLFVTSLYGCATTDISEKEVISLNFELKKRFSNKLDSISPGEKYFIDIDVTESGGNVIKTPNLTMFKVKSPNASFKLIDQKRRRIVVQAVKDNFFMASMKKYELEVSYINKTEVYSQQGFDVDWAHFPQINYSGVNGDDGSDGADGLDGMDSEASIDGKDGKEGEDGESGGGGKDISIAVAYYDVSDMEIPGVEEETMLLLYNMTDNEISLVKHQKIKILSSGGKGGDGGDGGDGGEPGTIVVENDDDGSLFSRDEKEGKFGEGGEGGDGGRGGNAGGIALYFINEDILSNIQTDTMGGRSGAGGEAGRGSGFASDGSRGWQGSDGSVKKHLVSKEEFVEIVRRSNNQYLEAKRIASKFEVTQ